MPAINASQFLLTHRDRPADHAPKENEYGSLSQSPYGILRILGGWGNVR